MGRQGVVCIARTSMGILPHRGTHQVLFSEELPQSARSFHVLAGRLQPTTQHEPKKSTMYRGVIFPNSAFFIREQVGLTSTKASTCCNSDPRAQTLESIPERPPAPVYAPWISILPSKDVQQVSAGESGKYMGWSFLGDPNLVAFLFGFL